MVATQLSTTAHVKIKFKQATAILKYSRFSVVRRMNGECRITEITFEI